MTGKRHGHLNLFAAQPCGLRTKNCPWPIEHAKPTPRLTTEIPAISSSREFIKVNDDGINFSQLGQPERRLRVKSIERQQWVDPRDGAVYIVETPKEHAIAVPVNIQ